MYICIFSALNTARPKGRTDERTIALATTTESGASRVIDPPRRAAWYLGRGWPLARLAAKTLLFSSPGSRTPAPAESEGEDCDATLASLRETGLPREITLSGFQRAFRAFKTGSIRFVHSAETFPARRMKERTNERTSDQCDVTWRAARRRRFGLSSPRGYRSSARTSPSNLFKVPHDQHVGLRVHFIYDDDGDEYEAKPREHLASFAREKKRGRGLLSIIYIHLRRKRKYGWKARFTSQNIVILRNNVSA